MYTNWAAGGETLLINHDTTLTRDHETRAVPNCSLNYNMRTHLTHLVLGTSIVNTLNTLITCLTSSTNGATSAC